MIVPPTKSPRTSCANDRSAFHWYSATELTVMLVRVALAEFAVHPEAAVPHWTVAAEPDRSVAKFTVA